MRRTTITLPETLVERFQREADRRRTSLLHAVRETLESRFGGPTPPSSPAPSVLNTRTIATLDHRHVSVVRPLQGDRFILLPEPP
ncbi:MAG: hypothetical protein FJ033_00520 [Chloroflexi bacterium]|nr:hypothetical protein [Chloroflexota bacterium]